MDSSREIIAHEQPLHEIFSEQYTFQIPRYQRPYAWELEHAEQLLDDINDALEDGHGAEVEDIAPYFLGSIVLVRPDLTRSEVDVVDGQQRLTTFSLLLACLRERLPDYKASIESRLHQRGDNLLGRPDIPRLTLRDRDQQFYREYILQAGRLGAKLDDSVLPDSQRNIWNNTILFHRRLAKLEDVTVHRLAKYILKRCYLVVVTTTNFQSAYRIFSVLNDRGLDLQATDILKASLIEDIPENERDKYTERWEDAEEVLGRSGFLDLMAHIRMIQRKTKLRQTVLDEIQQHVLPFMQPQAFIDGMVAPLSEAMTVLSDARHESAKDADKINEIIRCLKLIDNRDWMPPALAFYCANRADHEALLRFFCDLERLAASMMLRRVGINTRIGRYGAVLAAMERGEVFDTAHSPLQLTDDEKSETIAALGDDIFLVRRVCRPLLLRLDQMVGDGMASYAHDTISIEHVLPQNPTHAQWLTDFPDEEERRSLVHKLGNLVLLSRQKNSSANNKPFAEKKDSYFAKRGICTFALTTEVVRESTWTPAVVRLRQERLIGVLREGWRL